MTETETLCNGKWLRLKRRGRWEYAERTNPGGGVMIIAVTPEVMPTGVTGGLLPVGVLPPLPSCPSRFQPQHFMAPPARIAQE